jgi:hypothetical protein
MSEKSPCCTGVAMDKKITPEQLASLIKDTDGNLIALSEELNRFFATPELTESEFRELFQNLGFKFQC